MIGLKVSYLNNHLSKFCFFYYFINREVSEDNGNILEVLRHFRNGAKFKKEVRKVLINSLNEKDIEGLK